MLDSHIPTVFNLTLCALCAEIFHTMNIGIPAHIGAPPLDTQLV